MHQNSLTTVVHITIEDEIDIIDRQKTLIQLNAAGILLLMSVNL